MPDGYEVEVDALSTTSTRIDTIVSGVKAEDGDVATSGVAGPGVVGHPELAAALEGFSRQALIAVSDASLSSKQLAVGLTDSARTYLDTDAQAAGSLSSFDPGLAGPGGR